MPPTALHRAVDRAIPRSRRRPSGNTKAPINAATATWPTSMITNHGSLAISPLSSVMSAPNTRIAVTNIRMRQRAVSAFRTVYPRPKPKPHATISPMLFLIKFEVLPATSRYNRLDERREYEAVLHAIILKVNEVHTEAQHSLKIIANL